MKNTALSIHEIRKRLPHRYPFLMIDRILERSPNEVVALKNISINESYFQGHFPTEPIMPGVLIGEAMAQAAAFIGGEPGAESAESMGDKAFLTGMNLKIEKPVVPGDQLIIKARLIKRLGKLMKISAYASVGKTVVATAEITVAMI
jgi:3-hydroxyacyl-[acyl-carrier-protein] dehydratase